MSSMRYPIQTIAVPLPRLFTLIIAFRMASQHLLWKNHLGFLLHPNVALNVQPETFKVAEIGTRTG